MAHEPSPLFWEIYEQVVADEDLDAQAWALVEAAFEGREALERALGGAASAGARAEATARTRPVPPRTWLSKVEVEGFRGIGKKVAIELPPGPGLTVVKGRNGTGKSSVAEALEVALTGECRRWNDRPADWKSGWKNLHHGETRIAAAFQTEGRGVTQISRKVSGEAELEDAAVEVLRGGEKSDLAALGWDEALATHRPILAYGDLGKLMNEGPSKLFDALKGILGLDEIVRVQQRLSDARKAREKIVEEAKGEHKRLVTDLGALDDPRAKRCAEALGGRKWKLEAVADLLVGGTVDERLEKLEQVQRVTLPEAAHVDAVVARVRAAVAEKEALAATEAGRHHETATLLQHALTWHGRAGEAACPVCGEGRLDAAWRARSEAALASMTAATARMRAVDGELEAAVRAGRQLAVPVPGALRGLGELGLSSEVEGAWAQFAAASEARDARGLVAQLEQSYPALSTAHAALMGDVGARLDASERRWAPLLGRLMAWHPKAEAAVAAGDAVKRLKGAEELLKGIDGDMRTKRFAPIAKQAQEIWSKLRQESSVSLANIELAGTATKRRVEIEVAIDGNEAAALGVMSQGEVNALALSMFIPRLTHEDSPFRFVVIDDPVQAMDPFKVDGLAQVLRDLAKTRQVIVLTHDTRLPEALLRMQIPATIYEVVRRLESVVEVRLSSDPVRQYLGDARALRYAANTIGMGVVKTVVPALCRSALEAALSRVARRRLLAAGLGHDAIDERMRQAKPTNHIAALALFGDMERGEKILPLLNKWGRSHADTFVLLKSGAHDGFDGDVEALCLATEGLAELVERHA